MTMTKRLFLGFGLALVMGACAPADPPADPSFATDVLPVMKMHCTRCHGDGGTLNADPNSLPPYNTAPEVGYFTSYDDLPAAECKTAPAILCTGAKTNAVTIHAYIHLPDESRMPPRPAARLSDWELQLLDNWTAKNPPKP